MNNQRKNKTKHQSQISIAQWNACTLTECKAAELSIFAKGKQIQIICISELGHRRKINGYPQHECNDQYTQSGIFWTDNIEVEVVKAPFAQIFADKRITTQIIRIFSETIIIHTYIAPDVITSIREAYWKHLQLFTESRDEAILITGDLNTKDKRFGTKHTENHAYLDNILNDFAILNDTDKPTRHGNVLDISLGNELLTERTVKWSVHKELDSDHFPTTMKLNITGNPKQSRPRKGERKEIMDMRKSIELCSSEIQQKANQQITLTQFNDILQQCVRYRTIRANSNSLFWNKDLNVAVKTRNKLRRKWHRAVRQNKHERHIKKRKDALERADRHFRKMYT
jgi:retrotransposon-encoded endonuclease